MDVEAKIKEEMRSLGCDSDMKISLAYHLYIHLVDDKLMYDTEYCYNRDIDMLYVVARPSKNEKINIYIPMSTSENISMDMINNIQENLCTVETGPSINLAFVDSDFTTVIYKFTKGIVDRLPVEKVNELKKKEERRSFINNELKKNRSEILNDALNGGVIDDEDCQIVD